MKRCSTCRQSKSFLKFTKAKNTKDGFHNQCKSCRKIEAHRRYIKYKNKYRNYCKHYQESDRGKKSLSLRGKRYREKYPEKKLAQITVHYAIKKGTLFPPHIYTCTKCFKVPAQEYHHHKGYSPEHWLDVVPVCIKCHKKIHSSS